MVGWRINVLWGYRRKPLEIQVLVDDKFGLLLSCRVKSCLRGLLVACDSDG